MKNDFQQTVVSEVKRRGRVTFAEFMSWALYHPRFGYYTRRGHGMGRSGDFFTNVQAGGLFGRLLTESFCEMWDYLGSSHLSLVELGAGNGLLAEQVLKALQEKGRAGGVTYYLVEKSQPAREEAHKRLSRFPRIKILDDLTSLEHVSGVEGCVFSNEFFDALPFHRVLRQGEEWQELYVVEDHGMLKEQPGPLSTLQLAQVMAEQDVYLASGQKAEICLHMDGVMAEIQRILRRGFVVSIDYGGPSKDLYREDRVEGTRQVYQKHRLEPDPFCKIGERDITAHVDFGRLSVLGKRGDLNPLVFVSQGLYFVHSAEAVLRESVETSVGQKRNASMAACVQQMIHPGSLGGAFHVLVQGKDVGRPNLSGGRVNWLNKLIY